jgi:hypothetical protein
MNIAVVIATCRQESIKRWLAAWKEDLSETAVIVVEDNPTIQFELPTAGYQHVEQHAWDDIDGALGDKSWIIPRRTSAIKSYGFLRAAQLGADAIWTLDDDCFPERTGPYLRSIESIMDEEHVDDRHWFNTIYGEYAGEDWLYPRGYPYDIRKKTAVHHGLWSNIPDLDGVTALKYPDFRTGEACDVEQVPFGKLFPMCGMNLTFTREMLPAMYFMLQGHRRDSTELVKMPYDRFDDIWAGLFAKKIADHLHLPVTTGFPSIIHTKESDPQERVKKEAPGLIAQELLWPLVRDWPLDGSSVAECYASLSFGVREWARVLPNPDYWRSLSNAMATWTELSS